MGHLRHTNNGDGRTFNHLIKHFKHNIRWRKILRTLKTEILEDMTKVILRMTMKSKPVSKFDVAKDKGKCQ